VPAVRNRQTVPVTDWQPTTRRNARSIQTTVGWIFFEPPCELLLAGVDESAGANYQPASLVRSS